jgi:low temperature requirement protein LtrA
MVSTVSGIFLSANIHTKFALLYFIFRKKYTQLSNQLQHYYSLQTKSKNSVIWDFVSTFKS